MHKRTSTLTHEELIAILQPQPTLWDRIKLIGFIANVCTTIIGAVLGLFWLNTLIESNRERIAYETATQNVTNRVLGRLDAAAARGNELTPDIFKAYIQDVANETEKLKQRKGDF